MPTYGPPWKLALIGAVAVVAGVALVLVDWTVPQLAAFVAMLLVARGALHVVTTNFEGVDGALSTLQGVAEIAVGVALLAWPSPTLVVVAVFVGVLVLARNVVEVTIVLATRHEHRHWELALVTSVAEMAVAAVLITRPFGSVKATATTLGVLALLDGGVEIVVAIAQTRGRHHARNTRAVRSVAAAS
jgi:uncharacterized membrane protein HdeD (DUF308 family)